MSRRSCRLASTGYYNSDDESDSSVVTNISYRENPVKVFKKKAGTRKAATRASTSSSSLQSPSTRGQVTKARRPSLSTQTDLTMGSASYATPRATPRPALIAAASSTHQTPIRSPPPPPERIRSSGQAVVYLRSENKERDKNCVDSSGYSSSEGINLKPPTPTTTTKSGASTSKVKSHSVAPSLGYRRQINSTLCGVKESLSTLTAKINHLTTVVNRSFITAKIKKTCVVLLLLLAVAACVWFIPSLLTTFSTLLDSIKAQLQTSKLTQHPVLSTIKLPPPNSVQYTTATDSVTLTPDVEAKVQNLREALQQKQELLNKMGEQFQEEMQNMRDYVKLVESNSARNLDHEVSIMGKKMDDQKQDFQLLPVLSSRMKALETQIAELSNELLSIQSQSALPCPDISAQKQLTPELQHAMEKWLTEHIQAQNAESLQGKGISSACAQPFANKMADFALETQGASVISTRCSETYRTRSACLSLFGFPLWYPTESPRTVIRGEPMLLPGKCWAFHGAHGILVIALSHPIRITHVTLDHVSHHNTATGRIDSAPKDFEVYGLKDEVEEGTLLGTFTYNEDGEPTQTFELPPSDVIYRVVELRVLSNWGHMKYTCLYRFRVHGTLVTAT